MVKKQAHADFETSLVAEAYGAVQDAMILALRTDIEKWTPILYTIWRMRIPLIRHILIMKMNYHVPRKTITTRLLTIDARAGASSAFDKIKIRAGYEPESFPEGRALSPSVIALGLRELPTNTETYDLKYLVWFSNVDGRVITEFVGTGKLAAADHIHPLMVSHSVRGEALEDLELKMITPWRIQTIGEVSIRDDRPNLEDITAFSIVAEGSEDQKEIITRIPQRFLQNMGDYHLPKTEITFNYDLTPTSHFQNVVLASLVKCMAPISALRVILQFVMYDHTLEADLPASSQAVRRPHGSNSTARAILPTANGNDRPSRVPVSYIPDHATRHRARGKNHEVGISDTQGGTQTSGEPGLRGNLASSSLMDPAPRRSAATPPYQLSHPSVNVFDHAVAMEFWSTDSCLASAFAEQHSSTELANLPSASHRSSTAQRPQRVVPSDQFFTSSFPTSSSIPNPLHSESLHVASTRGGVIQPRPQSSPPPSFLYYEFSVNPPSS